MNPEVHGQAKLIRIAQEIGLTFQGYRKMGRNGYQAMFISGVVGNIITHYVARRKLDRFLAQRLVSQKLG